MNRSLSYSREAAGEASLQVYLLGSIDFESALALQRRLIYQVAGERSGAALVLCEHPALITVGRQGSRSHILCDSEELRARRWKVRWVNRGGGCLLHQPGQLAVYPILPLDRFGLGLRSYLDRLHDVVIAVLGEYRIAGAARANVPGVWVGDRPIAVTGVAVRDWVSYYGTVFNLNPYLEPFRRVRWGSPTQEPMTSLQRERRGAVRPALIRERFVEHFCAGFGISKISLFSDHPALLRQAPSGPVPARS